MKLLVTGSNGFIGRRLCKRLSQSHTVVPYDLAQGDLSDENALAGLEGLDFVYHLAARTFVPHSWENPHSFYQSNIMGSVTVLEFCRKREIPLVFLSAYVYGTPKYLPIDEAHPLSAPSPYHMSKLACESLCAFYASCYDTRIRVIRPFNVYGEGQSKAFLLPKIMRQIFSPEIPVIEVFDLSPKRDYIFVDDVIAALVLSQKPWRGLEVFNIGTGVSICVKEAIETMLGETRCNKTYYETGEKRGNEIDDCRADITKARAVLGFSPEYSFAQGIRQWLSEIEGGEQ